MESKWGKFLLHYCVQFFFLNMLCTIRDQKLRICLDYRYVNKMVNMFQDALLYWETIVLCYSHQTQCNVTNQLSPPLTQ
jgi:hypothetical protein